MISETEVKATSDEELLEIWKDQNDYVAQVVAWVKAEIEKRNLDTSGIYVPTLKEKQQARETASNFALARFAAIGQAFLGLVLIGGALISSFSPDTDFGETWEIIIGAVGALLIVYAIGVWRGKRWALTSGVVIYSLITLLNISTTIFYGIAFFKSNEAGGAAFGFILAALFTLLSGGLALILNKLRKRGR
ncbi:MAG: hypothetical protein WAM91_01370 [Candidatus Acidiferrales bacterium]